MRHLMSPLDFTVEELDRLFDLAGDIEANMAKYLPLVFMNPVPVHDLVLNPLC